MKITIEIECGNAAFGQDLYSKVNYANQLLSDQVQRKLEAQIDRPDCLCDHPEAEDVIRDINGNTCGTIRITKE